MMLESLSEWNTHFRRADIPLELFSSAESNNFSGKEFDGFGIIGDVELRPAPGSSAISSNSFTRLERVFTVSSPHIAREVFLQFEKNDLVLAPAITPKVATQLRERNIMFADKRGNSFFAWQGMLIDFLGKSDNGKASISTATQRVGSLFTPRHAQISALLLSYPSLLSAPIRELAAVTGVSVGTASNTLDLLREAGYLYKVTDGYRINNYDSYLDSWAGAYPTSLGAKQLIFRGTGEVDRLRDSEPLGWISGELAVPSFISGGNTAHFFVADESATKRLIAAARLRRDNQGEVVIRKAFWSRISTLQLDEYKDPLISWPAAPIAVIYADLMSVGDPRLLEVAQELKKVIGQRSG